MEREYWRDSAFVTLTYDDVNLPPTLRPRHLQLFVKRLRKALAGRKIKYYACGEYGDKGGLVYAGPYSGQFVHRPHYHIILFGVSPIADRLTIQECWKFCRWDLLEQTERGRKAIGTVTYDSCRYVAGYVQKKLYGSRAKEVYNERHIAPFCRMSKGLGLQFALDNRNLLTESLEVGLRGYSVALPKYYRDKLNIDPNKMKERFYDLAQKEYESYLQKHNYDDCSRSRAMYSARQFVGVEEKKHRYQRGLDLHRKFALKNVDLEFDVL